MKKRIVISTCIAGFLLATTIYYYVPLKYAVTKESISVEKKYIIVKPARVDDISWRIVPDEHNKFKEQVYYAKLLGNYPQGCSKNVSLDENNNFICYGEITGYEPGGIVIFNVTNWDIMYPVSYDWAVFEFLHPKSYLSRLDYNLNSTG